MFGQKIRSTIEGGRGCNKCVPVLRGNGTKIAPTGYIFDQPPGGMSWVRGKLAGHVGGHVVLSPEEGVLVTSPGTESSYPRPSQLLNNSELGRHYRYIVNKDTGDDGGYDGEFAIVFGVRGQEESALSQQPTQGSVGRDL